MADHDLDRSARDLTDDRSDEAWAEYIEWKRDEHADDMHDLAYDHRAPKSPGYVSRSADYADMERKRRCGICGNDYTTAERLAEHMFDVHGKVAAA